MQGFRKRSSLASALAVSLTVLAGFVTSAEAATTGPAAGVSAHAQSNAVASFDARGSVGEAYAVDAAPGTRLLLVDRRGDTVARGRADRFGSKVFHDQRPGARYRILGVRGGKVAASKRFRILRRGENPSNSFYARKTLDEGLNYVTMRDGVELAMTVRLPQGKSLADGPFPTFVEYSGYQTAAPNDALASLISGQSDPLAPAASTAVGSVVGPLLNFAVVSVQMRGTGCSGGAFDLFGLPSTYDGYDMIETVGNQPWVKGGKVGMGGISFSGITQLFTAGTRPPHLAAVSPMSVVDDRYLASVYPGGIFNEGFALEWLTDRMEDARPAPQGGQDWAKALTLAGDEHCIENQRMRLQSTDAVARTRGRPYRSDEAFDERAPAAWIDRIEVPVFWVGQFQDEQTGGHFVESLAKLDDNEDVWITLQNGVHADSLGPSSITRWVEFMNLFVADRIPVVPPVVLSSSGALYRALADAPALPVQQSRFAGYTDVDQARAEFEQDPRVRILMDNGAALEGSPGAIGAAWEMNYDSWPVRQAKPTPYYFGSKGKLLEGKPKRPDSATYIADPDARPPQTLVGDAEADAWKAEPPYDWRPLAEGRGLGFRSPTLKRDTVIAGASSLDLYLKSSRADTDIQATLTEIRPDGRETYVQNGWLRASHRRLDEKLSTVNDPMPTHFRADAQPLPTDRFALVRVPIYPVAHAFRAGSRLRVTVSAVGGDRPIWDFATIDRGKTRNEILLGGRRPSRIVLPVLARADAQGTPLPGPTALRGQPSRVYSPASNGG